MELLQLKYFRELAKTQHLGKTAQHFLISAPSLSLTVKRLENELGLPLFDRIGRNLVLNENGKCFLAHVETALDALEQATGEMHERLEQKEFTVSIALTSPLIWRSFFQQFKDCYPDIRLKENVITLDQLNEKKEFPYDFFLGNGWDIKQPSEWNIRQVRKPEDTMLLVSKSHPLAVNETISLKELQHETFISLGDLNPSTTHFIYQLCHACGFEPYRIVEANYFMRIRMLKENQGVVVTSNVGIENHIINDGSIAKIRVTEPDIKRYQVMAWKATSTLSKTDRLFMKELIGFYGEINVSGKQAHL